MIFLSAADTEAVIDWRHAIQCIRKAYSSAIVPTAVPGRLIAADGSEWIRCMSAVCSTGRYVGTKQISRTRGGKVIYVITLFDKASGELSHLIDAISITAWRTASTSAVALAALSTGGPVDLAILGSGLEAQTHAKAIFETSKIRSVSIFSPTVANRERFAGQLRSSHAHDTRAVGSAEEAVRGATHVVAAARPRDEMPVLHGSWLAPGTVVISVGSTTPSQREIDVSVVERASLIISDVPDELSTDTGDMIAARDAGIEFEHKLFSLQDLLQGRVKADPASGGVTMFKSVGSALQDISFAEYIAESAARDNVGTALDLGFRIKQSIGRNS